VTAASSAWQSVSPPAPVDQELLDRFLTDSFLDVQLLVFILIVHGFDRTLSTISYGEGVTPK
jgi:hypothetical protein